MKPYRSLDARSVALFTLYESNTSYVGEILKVMFNNKLGTKDKILGSLTHEDIMTIAEHLDMSSLSILLEAVNVSEYSWSIDSPEPDRALVHSLLTRCSPSCFKVWCKLYCQDNHSVD